MKSAIGIGSLLMDGLGDTIRVSLTEDPELEIDPCRCPPLPCLLHLSPPHGKRTCQDNFIGMHRWSRLAGCKVGRLSLKPLQQEMEPGQLI